MALILACAVYLAAVAVAGREAVRALRGTNPTRHAWGLWALLLTLVATFAALYVSGFNIQNDGSRGRYVLPAYIPLFVLLGAGIARLATRSRLRPVAFSRSSSPSISGPTSSTCGRWIRRRGRAGPKRSPPARP